MHINFVVDLIAYRCLLHNQLIHCREIYVERILTVLDEKNITTQKGVATIEDGKLLVNNNVLSLKCI
jgi:hypothetical protein